MKPSPLHALLALVLPLVLAGCAAIGAAKVPLGTAPTYLSGITPEVPNAAALLDRIYTPGLDDGYVPQGLASADGHLFVSSYLPTPDLKANTGPCRVFQIEIATGKTAGHIDLPADSCTHAGGLAHLGNDYLFLADTRKLFLIDLKRALPAASSVGASKSVKIAGLLRGSFAAFDGRYTWIGTWTKDAAKARMYRLDPNLFERYDGQTVQEERAVESIPIPVEAQGAAFNSRTGELWVSASNGQWGKLYRLDRQGRVQAEYPMPAGLEDLTFDEQGRLWGLSESGTRKYQHWPTRFPYLFRIDTALLKAP